ncbi:MAG: hypothetical protein R3E79_45120 [Caldilineaceae bacterium]
MPQRTFLAGAILLPLAMACGAAHAGRPLPATQAGPLVTVYKSPT